MKNQVQKIAAMEVLDSRGFPTIEVSLTLENSEGRSYTAHALVPSGASRGSAEILELRDENHRYLGKGVRKAIDQVETLIAPQTVGKSFEDLNHWDKTLKMLSDTPLGGNALLGASMAYARAHASAHHLSLDRYLSQSLGTEGRLLPLPLMNIFNGGKHADNGLQIQEFMIAPLKFETFSEGLRACVEIFHHLKQILLNKGLSTAVGDEGGFAPVITGKKPHTQAFHFILQAIEKAGYRPDEDIVLAIDAAATEFCTDSGYAFEGDSLGTQDLIEIYRSWTQQFPLYSIEDGLAEKDWEGWQALTTTLGRYQLVGDDLFVTNTQYLQKGIELKAANAILIKPNQIGTVSETLKTIELAKKSQYQFIISHRSGETEDTFIADLALASESGQIKTGSACRTERVAKYNQLLRLEKKLGEQARFSCSLKRPPL
jgi:enolase